MKLLETLKNKLRFLKKNEYVLLAWNIRRLAKQKQFLKNYSDEEAITKMYLVRMNRVLNINNPKTFTEKLQWLKLNFRTAEQTICADKYAVRDYLIKKGYEKLLNNIIGVWDDVDKIDFNLLPNKFVLKATHGSSMHLIVKDKTEVNWVVWKKIMKSWLKQNIYTDGREWPYKNIKPQIICEEFIETNGEDLKDFKIHCFNGEVEFIQVDGDRFENHKRSFYNKSWEILPLQQGNYDINVLKVIKPKKLDEMIQIAKELSKSFPFCRIDLYNIGCQIIFGEITFYPDSGFIVFNPEESDLELGKKLHIRNTLLN